MPRSKMIFKDLEYCLYDLRSQIKSVDIRDKKQVNLLTMQLGVLEKITDYVDSYEWLSKDESKEKLRYIRASKYDYFLVRQEKGLTEAAIKTFMKYCIKRIKEKIGDNTLDLIMQGDYMTALTQFMVLSGKLSLDSLLLTEVYKNLPEVKFEPFFLLDCAEEIKYIQMFSKSNMEKRFAALDVNKLAFLHYILIENSPKFAEDKAELIGLLYGRITNEAYFENLEYRTSSSSKL